MSQGAPYPPPDDGYRGPDGRRRTADGDVSARDMTHEERREREKPTKTLFVRNVPYEATQQDISDVFSPYGKIDRIYDLIAKRGMVFVTYTSLDDADRAKRALQGHLIRERAITIHYSLPRDDSEGGAPPSSYDRPRDRGGYDAPGDRALASLFVLIRDVTGDVTNEEIRELFTKWGSVKDVRDGRGKTVVTKFVDYWEYRDAQAAVDQANGTPFRSGHLEVRFAHSPATRNRGARPDRYGAYDQGGQGYGNRDYQSPYSGGPPSRYDPYGYPGAQHRDYGAPGFNPPPPYGAPSSGYGHQASGYPPAQYDYPPPPGGQGYPPPSYGNYGPPSGSSGAPGGTEDQALLQQINQLHNMLSHTQQRGGTPAQSSTSNYPPPSYQQTPSYPPSSGGSSYPPPPNYPPVSAPGPHTSYPPLQPPSRDPYPPGPSAPHYNDPRY